MNKCNKQFRNGKKKNQNYRESKKIKYKIITVKEREWKILLRAIKFVYVYKFYKFIKKTK